MIYFAGITLSLFLSILLLLKRQRQQSEQFLMGWLTLISAHQLLFWANHTEYSYDHPWMLGISLPLPAFHASFLYLYTKSHTSNTLSLKKEWIHFLPGIGLGVLAIPFLLLSGPEKVQVFINGGVGFEWFTLIQLPVILLSGLFYVIRSMRLIIDYRQSNRKSFTDSEKLNLEWLKILVLGLGVILLLVFFFDDSVIFFGVVIFMFCIGMVGISRVQIFVPNIEPILPGPVSLPPELTPVRYAKSGLSETDSSILFDKLSILMQREKLYTDPDLKLSELAARLEIPGQHLSQAINEQTKKKYFHYINSLRVEAFLNLVHDPANQHLTLLALAYESGFKSKSTFNKYFKLHTGRTPSSLLKAREGEKME